MSTLVHKFSEAATFMDRTLQGPSVNRDAFAADEAFGRSLKIQISSFFFPTNYARLWRHIALLDPRQRGDEAILCSCETVLAPAAARIQPTYKPFAAPVPPPPATQTAQ